MLTDLLNCSVFVSLNWFVSGPFVCDKLGYINKISTYLTSIFLLGTPTISAAVLRNISDGGIMVLVVVEVNLTGGGTSWPLI